MDARQASARGSTIPTELKPTRAEPARQKADFRVGFLSPKSTAVAAVANLAFWLCKSRVEILELSNQAFRFTT